MSIFDKILGKSSSAEATADKEEKPVRGDSISTKEIESPRKVEKKPVVKKVKTEKTAKIAKPQSEAGQPLAEKKEVAKRKVAKKEENIAHRVLLEILISEKSTLLAAQNKYVFKVTKNAGKFQIKEAIEGYYGVQVVSVNTIKINPKKTIHGRTIGWKKGFKKAVVTLREGDSIAAVEGV
ncbi:MAG: 50S ribosomal protein L23 [Candidatus Moranbacteria bacterium]|nr:50S ribosomal protein L23 [Candidatus Moranbacteria bacterium]